MAKVSGGHAASDAEWDAFCAGSAKDWPVYGVASTGIHCRPGCPARRPLRKNLRLFADVALAEAGGYRACKRCGGGLSE